MEFNFRGIPRGDFQDARLLIMASCCMIHASMFCASQVDLWPLWPTNGQLEWRLLRIIFNFRSCVPRLGIARFSQPQHFQSRLFSNQRASFFLYFRNLILFWPLWQRVSIFELKILRVMWNLVMWFTWCEKSECFYQCFFFLEFFS